MAERSCLAPVFPASSAAACATRTTAYATALIVLVILLFLSGGSESILCLIRQIGFRIRNCRKGNSDPAIDLTPDRYQSHVRSFKNLYGKSNEWEQWMLDNRGRYAGVFDTARQRPAVLNIAFRYETAPIAYSPPWTSETAHMAALEALAEPAYPGYDFNFIFGGDTATSYANVIAGIAATSSYTSSKDVFLYYETIFNHEFGHVMGLLHHYDTPAEVGAGRHFPPGETGCIMDRNSSQYCSACRTALMLPLDADNDTAISAANSAIRSRYPY